MKLAICIVSQPDSPHSEAFREVAETLQSGARALGHDALITSRTDEPGRRTIVLGPNLLHRSPQALQPDAILYNLEQVEDGPWFEPGLLELFRRHEVWDYSAQNAARLEQRGVARPRVVPIGWAPELKRIAPALEDIDVLFYGSLNPRREAVLDELRRAGVRVEAVFGVYGEARDRLISRARIVVNIHYFEAKVFEVVRVSYLLANGRAVVSERGASPLEEAPFEGGVCFSDHADLAKTCLRLLNDPAELARLKAAGQRIMESRPEAAYLEPVIGRATAPTAAQSAKPDAASAPKKLASYYGFSRPDVVAQVDANGRAILEIGCAGGAMGTALLAKGAREVVGIEVVPEAVLAARGRLNAVYRFDLETAPQLPYPDGYFDIVTCADVLEHLRDPESTLRHLRRWLRPGGELVCSIPNVRHESVLVPLLKQGRWTYEDAGILDRTHLRFYTRESIEQMIAGLGFKLTGEMRLTQSPPSAELEIIADAVARLGGDAARFRLEATVIQYVFRAVDERAPAAAAPAIADPWRGSRPQRFLFAPVAGDTNDCWAQALTTLAQTLGAQPNVTIGVALPREQLRAPPAPLADLAARGGLDLLLLEAPKVTAGWERMLAGTSAFIATSDAVSPRAAAQRVGVEVLEGRSLIG